MGWYLQSGRGALMHMPRHCEYCNRHIAHILRCIPAAQSEESADVPGPLCSLYPLLTASVPDGAQLLHVEVDRERTV